MPEFALNVGESHNEFAKLDSFTQGYIEALFFTEEEPGSTQDGVGGRKWNPETDSSLPGDVGFSDIDSKSLAHIVADCKAWQEANAALLESAYEFERSESHSGGLDYDDAAAGRDYWFTRNGHGVGFWDRGLGAIGDALSDAAGRHTVDVYLGDDGRVYVMGAE